MKRLNYLFWRSWKYERPDDSEVEELKTQIPQISINEECNLHSTIASPNPSGWRLEEIWEIPAKKVDFFPKDPMCMTTDEMEEKWPHLKNKIAWLGENMVRKYISIILEEFSVNK